MLGKLLGHFPVVSALVRGVQQESNLERVRIRQCDFIVNSELAQSWNTLKLKKTLHLIEEKPGDPGKGKHLEEVSLIPVSQTLKMDEKFHKAQKIIIII